MSEPGRTRLPIRRAPFQGVANRTLGVLSPTGIYRACRGARAAPNLLLLMDDARSGNGTRRSAGSGDTRG